MSAVPAERAERLARLVADRGLDALIVGDLVRPGDSGREAIADLSWLCGFQGTSGLALVGPERRAFVTDFRYLERVEGTLPAGFDLIRAEHKLVPIIAELLAGQVGYDEAQTSVRCLAELRERAPRGVELVGVEGMLADLRRAKDEREIETIAAAAELADRVLAELAEGLLVGRSERELAIRIEARIRELGAEAPAFPPIVATGVNGSLPHAVPGDREVRSGDLVVVDLGAIVDGYCSDCTRTLAAGDVAGEEREVYGLVLHAQREALRAIRAGIGGSDADAVAREVIDAAGYGERFGHGLGHGVGIEVHEPPRLSKRSEDTLRAGDVVTVEPGIYVPGRFGVRIEDLVVVTENGHRNLSSRPKELC